MPLDLKARWAALELKRELAGAVADLDLVRYQLERSNLRLRWQLLRARYTPAILRSFAINQAKRHVEGLDLDTPAGAVAGGLERRRGRTGTAATAGTRRGSSGIRVLKGAIGLALCLVAPPALSEPKPSPPLTALAYETALNVFDVVCTTAVATCGGAGGFTGGTVTGATVFTNTVTFGTALDAANSISFGVTANCIRGEGTAADVFEHDLCFGNGGIDVITSLPWLSATQTILISEGAQTIGGNKTLSGNNTLSGSLTVNNDILVSWGTGALNQIQHDTINTPDAMKVGLSTTSNSLLLVEVADINADSGTGMCGTANCADPTFTIMSATGATTTAYRSNAYWGTAGRATKTLVDATLTSVFQVGVPDNVGTGGTFAYSVFASDGTAHQLRTGQLYFSAVNEGGTETCATPTDAGTSQISATTGTLTCTFDCDETPTNGVNIQVNCNTSLTPTTMEIYYQVTLAGPGQVTPQ